MIANFFKNIESFLRASIYLCILAMGVSAAILGAYVVAFLCLRVGQLLWDVILSFRWNL
jgi:hypothetical protein